MAEQNSKKELEEVKEISDALKDAFISLGAIIKNNFTNEIKSAKNETKEYQKYLKSDITKSINELGKKSFTLVENQQKLNKGQVSSKDISKQILELENKELLLQNSLEKATFGTVRLQKKLTEATKEQIAKLKEQEILAKQYNQNLGITAQIFSGLSKSLEKLGISSDTIEDIGNKLKVASTKGKVGFSTLFNVVGKGILDSLKNPLDRAVIGLALFKSGINDIKKAFEIFKEYNSIFAETGRSLGISTSQSAQLIRNAQSSGTALSDNLYTAKQLGQAISDENAQLGLSVDLGAQNAAAFADMTTQMGLSAEEASKIQKLGLLTNQDLNSTNKSIAAGIVAAQKSTGVQVNARQVYQEIGKLNAGITAKFQQNPEALAKAVVQAKALGTSLEQMDKVGDSLLDWQSSIENQLKAELITGRQLNLEKARYAALTGDTVGLMNEVAGQVGSLSDFQHMNVIAQKSLAEAFGMSKDELADMLQKQEVFNKLGDVSGKSAAEQLKIANERGISESDSLVVNLKQQAAADKLAATWDSIKESLAALLDGPFGIIVNLVAELAKQSWAVYTAIALFAGVSLTKTLAALGLMITQWTTILGLKSASAAADTEDAAAQTVSTTAAASNIPVQAALTGEKELGALASITAAISETLGIATIPIMLGIGAVLGAVAGKTLFAKGGIVTSRIDNATVGEAGPEAIIPLNSPKANNILGGGNSNNNSELLSAIKDMHTTLKVTANRPAVAYINGKDPFARNLGTSRDLGTSQTQNYSYKLA